MADPEYNAKFLKWIYQYLPLIGTFMLLSQMFGPLRSFYNYKSGNSVEAEFVSKVHFAATGPASRGLGQGNCAYNYRLPDNPNLLYLIHECNLLPGFSPEPAKKYPVVIYQAGPPLIVSQVSYALGWMSFFTALMGAALLVLPRWLIPRLADFKP